MSASWLGSPAAKSDGNSSRPSRDLFECPICHCVRACDRERLHSHILNVHHADIGAGLPPEEARLQHEMGIATRVNLEPRLNHMQTAPERGSACETTSDFDHHTAMPPHRTAVPHPVDPRVRPPQGRDVATPRIALGRNGKIVRCRRRPLRLRCPICTNVWAADFEGICSHATAVHGIALDGYTTVKDLLEARAQRLSLINVETATAHLSDAEDQPPTMVSQLHVHASEGESQFLHRRAFPQASNVACSEQDMSRPSQLCSESDFERSAVAARREVRSLSDFGIHYNLESHPVRKRSASVITPLSPPQLENVYQAHKQMRTRRQLESAYKLQQDDKNRLFALVRPTEEDDIAELDYKVAKCLIGGYAIPPNDQLGTIHEGGEHI